jgi:VWFA-related protein
MSHVRHAWTLFAAWSVTAALTAQNGQPRPLFHAGRSELVVLPVAVSDRNGAFVGDLTRDRFLVYDNKRIQDIAYFTSADAPVSVALVVDSSASMGAKLAEVRVATHRFAALSHPEDELLIYAFNDSVRETFEGQPIPAGDANELDAALGAFHAEGRTALYDALAAALDAVEQRPLSRKVVILMSDGGDNASTATLAEVLERARRSSVTIYTIGLFDPFDPDANAGVLESLADTTGGRRFLPRSPGPLMQACEQIAREIRSAYTLSYVPPERDAQYHHVEVRATRGDGRHLVVRTRPGYLAAAPTR